MEILFSKTSKYYFGTPYCKRTMQDIIVETEERQCTVIHKAVRVMWLLFNAISQWKMKHKFCIGRLFR